MLELIKSLAEKAGVSNSPEFIQLAASPELQALSNITVDPLIERALNSNLLSVESAKIHKDVIAHVKNQELGKVDNSTRATLKELGLDDATITEVMSTGTTDQKVATGLKKLADLKEKHSKANGGDKEKALAQQIADLQVKLQSDIAAEQNKYNSLKGEYDGFRIESELFNALSEYPLRDDLSKEDLRTLTKQDLNRYLSQKGAKTYLGDNGLELRDAETGVQFLDRETGRSPQFKDVLAKVLADNKRLKVSSPEPPKSGNAQAQPVAQAVNMPQDARLEALIQAQLQG